MRESLPVSLLLMLARASPDQLAAVERYLGGQPLPELQQEAPGSQPERVGAGLAVPGSAEADSGYQFRRKGSLWEVVFDGGQEFYVQDTLGASYLDYLLHHPNEPIGAFELEVAVTPEKGEVRSRNSIQPESDPQALREYRQELGRLQAEREDARGAGKQQEVARLESEIKVLELALKRGCAGADAGERARINVRKAVAVVMAQLRKSGPQARAFAEHLDRHLSTGYTCLYSHPQGRIWG